mmetsp:Transcript_27024/g.69941  ORF Transcript_27024/g.69941 Transcript_27024/m.69941 type:complete len:225 (+) Transcript_27024:185-859(+)
MKKKPSCIATTLSTRPISGATALIFKYHPGPRTIGHKSHRTLVMQSHAVLKIGCWLLLGNSIVAGLTSHSPRQLTMTTLSRSSATRTRALPVRMCALGLSLVRKRGFANLLLRWRNVALAYNSSEVRALRQRWPVSHPEQESRKAPCQIPAADHGNHNPNGVAGSAVLMCACLIFHCFLRLAESDFDVHVRGHLQVSSAHFLKQSTAEKRVAQLLLQNAHLFCG